MPEWKDIDEEFSTENNGDVNKDRYIEAVKNSIRNIMLTMPGSRRMQPEFASPLFGLLFEPIDEQTARSVGNLILQSIKRWDNRVIVDNIQVNARTDNNTYEITLHFRIKNQQNSNATLNTTIQAR